eukprot:COSAG02_NODE_4623_length_5153_cov_3.148793_8_plen_210_part_00
MNSDPRWTSTPADEFFSQEIHLPRNSQWNSRTPRALGIDPQFSMLLSPLRRRRRQRSILPLEPPVCWWSSCRWEQSFFPSFCHAQKSLKIPLYTKHTVSTIYGNVWELIHRGVRELRDGHDVVCLGDRLGNSGRVWRRKKRGGASRGAPSKRYAKLHVNAESACGAVSTLKLYWNQGGHSHGFCAFRQAHWPSQSEASAITLPLQSEKI